MAIFWVSNGSAIAASGTSPRVTGAANHPKGSLIVVGVVAPASATTVSSITNTAGDTFTQCANARNPDLVAPGMTDIWYAYNSKGNSSDVVTVNSSDVVDSVFVECYVGALSASDPFEVATKGTASVAASSVTSAIFTPANNGNMNFSVISSAVGGHTYVAGLGYILRQTSPNNHANEDDTTGLSGPQTASFSISSGTDTFSTSVATFKAETIPASPSFNSNQVYKQMMSITQRVE